MYKNDAKEFIETANKEVRAVSECLGDIRRRRTWTTAKILGERRTRNDPGVSE